MVASLSSNVAVLSFERGLTDSGGGRGCVLAWTRPLPGLPSLTSVGRFPGCSSSTQQGISLGTLFNFHFLCISLPNGERWKRRLRGLPELSGGKNWL